MNRNITSAIVVMWIVSLTPQIVGASGVPLTRQINMSKTQTVSKVLPVESEKMCIASAISSSLQALAQHEIKPKKIGFNCGVTTALAVVYASRDIFLDQPAKFWNWLTR